jgi:hypothetical protein
MALNYRIHLEPEEARRIDSWREANPWAREFWSALWDAAMTAWETPGLITEARRIAFVYREDYFGGALFMALPSGRLLTYPRPRWREVEVLDKDGKPTGEKCTELSFRRAHGRTKLWHGTPCENRFRPSPPTRARPAAGCPGSQARATESGHWRGHAASSPLSFLSFFVSCQRTFNRTFVSIGSQLRFHDPGARARPSHQLGSSGAASAGASQSVRPIQKPYRFFDLRAH